MMLEQKISHRRLDTALPQVVRARLTRQLAVPSADFAGTRGSDEDAP
jgi:hypothetical protein